MINKVIIALIALFVGLVSTVSDAQTAGAPTDLEDNPWRILTTDFNDPRLRYLYGTDRHRIERTFEEVANFVTSYEAHIGANLYPNRGSVDLYNSHCSGFKPAELDQILEQAKDSAAWSIENGFRRNGRFFNIVPNVDANGDAEGGWVNLIICDPRDGKVGYIRNLKDPEQSNYLGIGSGYLGIINHPIHRMVIPHELAHVYQMNFMPHVKRGTAEGNAIKTIREGLADAIGMRIVFEQFGSGGTLEAKQRSYLSRSGITGYHNDLSRRMFMIRPYNIPLQLNEGGDKALLGGLSNQKGQALISAVDDLMQKRMSYFTSGFFYHIMERYLDRPGQIHDLYRRYATAKDTRNIYPKLDAFLKTRSKVRTEGPVLGLVLAQFLTEYAEWWDFRTSGKIGEHKWIRASFGRCPTIVLGANQTSGSQDVDFAKFAGGCVDVDLDATLAERYGEIELFVTSQDGDPDRIYLGIARIEQAGKRLYSCYERAKLRSLRGTFPCLMNPVQGRLSKSIPALAGKKVRAFHVPPMYSQGLSGRMTIRVIIADVPNKLDGAGTDARRADAATYRLNAAFDSATVKGHGVPKNKSVRQRPGGQAAGTNGQLQEARPPRLARADGPLTPTGDTSLFDASMRDVLNGNTRMPFASALAPADAAGQFMFLIETSTDEEDGSEIGFFTDKDYFGAGEIGRFRVQGLYGFGDELGQQNPNKPSYIEIEENSPEALVYSATIHVCAYTPAQLMASAIGEKSFDPCKDGTPRSFEIENSIAFPALLPGIASQAGAFEAAEQTQALRDYQNVRLARLGIAEAINLNFGQSSPGAAAPGLPGSDSSTSSEGACTVRSAAASCDCSCAAKICLEQKRSVNSASRDELSCRLTCGKKWKLCQP